MEIGDLDHRERLALVALVKAVIGANGRATDEESATVRRLAAALGRATYRQLADEADERLSDEESLRGALRQIERPDARELLLGTALEAATADVPGDAESAFFAWLRHTWHVPVRIEPPPARG